MNDPLVDTFVRRVKRSKRVLGVFVDGCEHQWSVLVVLDGDNGNRARSFVYGAEYEVLQIAGTTQFDFRVIDASEYPDQEPAEIIPADYVTVWAREPERMAAARERSTA